MKGKKYDAVALAQFKMFQNMQMKAPKVVATVMTQLSMKAALRAWGDPAKTDVREEMQQLHMRDTFQSRHWKTLTPKERD
jgi:hypothetical protein